MTNENKRYEWIVKNPRYPEFRKAFEEYDIDKTYGGPGGIGDYLVPDTMWGLVMSHIFYNHDAKFEIGGGQKEFDRANSEMLDDCIAWIDKEDWWMKGTNWFFKHRAKKRAKIYYFACDKLGFASFNWDEDKK